MYLSELCGRLQQVLKENGDMPVVRHRDFNIEGVYSDSSKNYKDIAPVYFYIYNDVKCIGMQDGASKNIKTNSKFVLL